MDSPDSPHTNTGSVEPVAAPRPRRNGPSRRTVGGIGFALGALLSFGGYAVLESDPFIAPDGGHLLFYLLVDEARWKLGLFSLGGACLLVACVCLVPPPVDGIRRKWLRGTVKVLLGLLAVIAWIWWSLWWLVLLLFTSDTFSSYSAEDGSRVLVESNSYRIYVWTQYAGPLYELRPEIVLTDAEAVAAGDCSLTSDGPELLLACGTDTVPIPRTGRP